MSDNCPICGKNGKKIRDHVREMKPISVFRCEACLIDFLETWDDEDSVKALYTDSKYVFKPNITCEKMKYDEYIGRVNRVKAFATKNMKLLDIGCGEGRFLRMIRPFVKSAEGTEVTSAQVEALRKEGFKIWDKELSLLKVKYDIICLFALLEHVPNLCDFIEELKRLAHKDTQIFIEVPNLLDPLNSCYDVPEYRDFFYRDYHQYYFSPKSLEILFGKLGFTYKVEPILQASITNHFHWIHNGCGQATTTDMSNLVFPRKPIMDKTPKNNNFLEIIDKADDHYRALLTGEGIGDLIACQVSLK